MSDIAPTDPSPPERARIDPPPPQRRIDALPVLYLVGFVILASALIYMWRHPSLPRSAVQDSQRVASMRTDVDTAKQESDALASRVAALEAKPAPLPATDLAPLQARITALEQRPAATPANLAPLSDRIKALEDRKPTDLGPLEAKVDTLEDRKPVDLGPLEAKIKTLEDRKPTDLGPLQSALSALQQKESSDVAALSDKLDAAGKQASALGPRLDQMDQQAKQAAASLASVTERAQLLGRVQAAGVALEAGQKLGDIQGAPPALARFAQQAPPTESNLKLSFDAAAQAAERASQPTPGAGQPLLDRMWTRAQQSVTVRQNDRVLVGDPISGVLAQARQRLEAGDLEGAVHALDGLTGPARAAMSDWTGRAQALLDARAAVAAMARG